MTSSLLIGQKWKEKDGQSPPQASSFRPMPQLRLPVRRGRRRLVLWLVVGLGVLIVFGSPLVGLLAEWPWFSALGYERVFATRLVASFTLGLLAGGVAFAFLFANLRFAQRGVVPNPVVMQASAQRPAVDVTRLVRRLALPTALVFALFFALAVSAGLIAGLQFLHSATLRGPGSGFCP